MALWIFGCMAFQFHPRTVAGKQCPTAPVQQTTVAIKSCCGRVIGYEVRAPRPGESAFVQCHCAEKKAAQDGTWLPPKLQPFFLPQPLVVIPPSTAEATPTVALILRESVRNEPPRVPPPNLS